MLTILVAHHAEALPFIDHYRLTSDSLVGGRLYHDDTVTLLVVGQGAQNLAVSIEKALTEKLISPPGPEDYWFNFGVAGSAAIQRGELVGINMVKHSDSDIPRAFYLLPIPGLAQAECLSVAAVQQHYPSQGVVDMELYWVTQCMSRSNNQSALRALKLVSDGPGAGVDKQSKTALKQLITQSSQAIVSISDTLISR